MLLSRTLTLVVLVAAGCGMGDEDVPAASAQADMPGPEVQWDTTWVDRAVTVCRTTGPNRELRWELDIPAPVHDVWRAWTEPDEIATWAAPAAAVDLRPGGSWEAQFFPDRPAGQRGSDVNIILELVPERLLRLEAGAPARFPTVRREKTIFTVTLEPASGGGTHLVATQTRWKEGAEWDEAFEAISHSNAEWLNWLHRRFADGPIDWQAMMNPGN